MRRFLFAMALLGVMACEPDSVDQHPDIPEVAKFDDFVGDAEYS